MAILNNMSLRVRLVGTMALMLSVLAGTLTYVAAKNVRHAMYELISSEDHAGIRMLVYALRQNHSDLTQELDENGQISRLIWPDMPQTLRLPDFDTAQAISGLAATVFRVDAGSGNFTRIATTLEDENGNRAIPTILEPGPAYDALSMNEGFAGPVEVRGSLINALYLPVADADGSVVGAIAVGRSLSAFYAPIQRSTLESLVIAAVVLCAMILFGFVAIRKMLRPLRDVTNSILKLSNGELDEEIRHLGRGDEIGKVANDLLVLQKSMQSAKELQHADEERSRTMVSKREEQDIVVTALTDGLSRLGSLDLTQHIENTPNAPFPQDYEGLRTSYNMLVDNLTESVDAIREVAEEVNGDARDMASSSIDLSRRTESQAATLEESAAALEQLSASIQSTASNAGDAEATTKENRTVAKRTSETVEDAIAAMASIEESSQKITQIISVIDDIAFQTNLLALNAGVEAARAGDAGRGFAVVASEVRALAQHSSASAQEIKVLIASSSDHVENGSRLVRKAGESLSDITQRVDRVAGLVSNIAVSAKEQSIGVTEINSGVRDLDAATQRNAAMAEEASAASEGLTNAADRLADHLGRFKMARTMSKPEWSVAAVAPRADNNEGSVNDADAFAFSANTDREVQLATQSQLDAFKGF